MPPTQPNTNKPRIKKPPLLFARTQRLIKKIESQLDGRFLSYWNSTNGSVCSNDVVGFYESLQSLGQTDLLYLFVKSGGGHGQSALRIVHLLRQYVSHFKVLVPLECCSAATMIALGADDIQMGPLAYLTPVDTSLTHDLSPIDRDNRRVSVSLDELNRVLKLWSSERGSNSGDDNPYKSIYQYIHPLVLGAVDRCSSLSIKLCKEILSYHLKDQKKAEQISSRLNSDYPSHSYPITLDEAKRIGLNVSPLPKDLNDLLLDLNECYSEMGQRALTDYDERSYHNNEILNILEAVGVQIFYQNDEDWVYRENERRWVSMNDKSSWHKVTLVKGRQVQSAFHIR